MTALLLGCDDAWDLTRIDDVRLVAAIAEPPEVGVGESSVLTAVIADPFGHGAEVALWQCPEPDLPCQVVQTALEGDTVSGTFQVGTVWIVACTPGTCGSPTEAQLRDPPSWLQELPVEGVAAGTKTVGLAEGEERRSNPVITVAPDPLLEVGVADTVPLRFVAAGVETASGLATGGGFARLSQAVSRTGDFTLDWRTPEDAGPARVYVVVDDGLGGAAVWRGDGSVR